MVGEASRSSDAQKPVREPRRRRVPPEKRRRVVRACIRCSARRTKCSGDNPCAACAVSSADCQYAPVEERITISRAEYDEFRTKAELPPQSKPPQSTHSASRTITSSPSNGRQAASGTWRPLLDGGEASEACASTNEGNLDEEHVSSEGRLLQDPDGIVRYLGESSGAAFLDQLREFMAILFPLAFNSTWPGLQNPEHAFISSLGQYQTHDSRPMLIADVNIYKLPSRTEASILLADLRYFAQDGSGDFGCGGIYYWYNMDKMLQEYHVKHSSSASINHATWNACFAVASQLNPACSPRDEPKNGENFFARAKSLLGNPLDAVSLGDVPTLALLAFYLLGMNRRDAAYIHISVAVHILIVHGVHRGWMIDEEGKRIFWTVYIIDRSLSCLMGRPPMIPDESIKIDIPRETSNLPTPDGLRAHIELSKISSYIVGNIYDVARSAVTEVHLASYVERSLEMLSDWLEHLPGVLHMPVDYLCDDRACTELHMAYNQLILLAIRPIMLDALKKAATNRVLSQTHETLQIAHISTCIQAARQNIRLCRHLIDVGRGTRLHQMNLHHLFNAACVLELSKVIYGAVEDSDLVDIAFSKILLEDDLSGDSNYTKDCAKVLADLKSLTTRLCGEDSPLAEEMTQGVAADPEETGAVATTPAGTKSRFQDADMDLHSRSHEYGQLLSWLRYDSRLHRDRHI